MFKRDDENLEWVDGFPGGEWGKRRGGRRNWSVSKINEKC